MRPVVSAEWSHDAGVLFLLQTRRERLLTESSEPIFLLREVQKDGYRSFRKSFPAFGRWKTVEILL